MIDLVSTAMAMGPPPGGAQGQGNPLLGLMPLVIIVLIFYFLMLRPQQKRAKQHKAFLDALKRGDEVMTSGGIIGRVAGLTDDVVTLEVDDKVRIKVIRSQIAGKPPEKQANKK